MSLHNIKNRQYQNLYFANIKEVYSWPQSVNYVFLDGQVFIDKALVSAADAALFVNRGMVMLSWSPPFSN